MDFDHSACDPKEELPQFLVFMAGNAASHIGQKLYSTSTWEGVLTVNSGPVWHAAWHDVSWWFEAIVVAIPPGL